MTAPKISPDAPLETVWKGAGWFNVYFFAKFALAYFGYLNLEPAYNALLFAAVVLPIGTRAFDLLRNVVCALAAAALLWHESWLPGPEAIRANAHNLTDFTASFLLDFVVNAVNPVILAWLAAGIVAWLFLRRWIRFSTLTVIGLVVTAFPQLVTWALPTEKEAPAKEVAAAPESAPALRSERAAGPLQPPQPANGTGEDVDRWLTAFFTQEENRGVSLPAEAIPESVSGVFDIAVVNICSLSNDDLAATGLHTRDRRRCVSSPPPADSPRIRPSTASAVRSASFSTALRRPGGKTGSISTTTDVSTTISPRFASWRASPRPSTTSRSFTSATKPSTARPFTTTQTSSTSGSRTSLFNLVALHDGNRAPGSAKSFDYAPLAKSLLDDLEGIMDRIEKSGRPVLFIVVPEHGAAVRGDKIQMARLREIPSPKITNVPVLVKFFGLKLDGALRTIEAPTSYLALAELMARTATSGVYRDREADASAAVDAILMDLPQTRPVSQNANASVVRFAGVHWVRLHAGKWIKYPE